MLLWAGTLRSIAMTNGNDASDCGRRRNAKVAPGATVAQNQATNASIRPKKEVPPRSEGPKLTSLGHYALATRSRRHPSSRLYDFWRRPRAIDDRRRCRLRPVHATSDEGAFGRWQPIGLLVLARRLVLEIQRERAVAIELRIVAQLTVNLFNGLGTNHHPWSISYIVIDQKPSTGGVSPFGNVKVYLLPPLRGFPQRRPWYSGIPRLPAGWPASRMPRPRPPHIIGAVAPRPPAMCQPLTSLPGSLVRLDAFAGDLGDVLQGGLDGWVEPGCRKACRHDADLGHPGQHRGVFGRRRGVFAISLAIMLK